jgi:DNA-binding response OmpR family regulator
MRADDLQNTYSILLVEDNEDIQEINQRFLTRRGYAIRLAFSLAQARKEIEENRPDAIVLDIMLPDGNGLDFLNELKSQGKNIPVLLLTALSESRDEVRALEEGADDYLAKPYENKVLAARLEALLRRAALVPETVTKGALKLETYSGQAMLNGVDLNLTRKEFDIILLLAQNEDSLLSTESIYEKVWGQPLIDDNNAIRTVLSRLRTKIEHSGYVIEPLRGKGYIFTKW